MQCASRWLLDSAGRIRSNTFTSINYLTPVLGAYLAEVHFGRSRCLTLAVSPRVLSPCCLVHTVSCTLPHAHCLVHAASRTLSRTHCLMHTASRTLSRTRCPMHTASYTLSHAHYLTDAVPLTLSHGRCPTHIISRTLSHAHYLTDAVPLTLSHARCPTHIISRTLSHSRSCRAACRYKTIMGFCVVYVLGMLACTAAAHPSVLSPGLFFFGLFGGVAIGSGGIKPNVVVLGADQVP